MRCPECGGKIKVGRNGEYYCSKCGLIIEKQGLIPSRETLKGRCPGSFWSRNMRKTEKRSWTIQNGTLVDRKVL